MRRIRFSTVADVFETYPALASMVAVTPSEEAPVACLERLARAGAIDDAVTLAPFVLPRREAVWWACRCVAAASGRVEADDRRAWDLAAAWVHRPDEARRAAALAQGREGDDSRPATWLARAAAWSGGAMEPNEHVVIPTPPDLAAKAARTAVLFAAARESEAARRTYLERCVSTALAIARDEGDIGEEVLRTVRARPA